MNIEQKLTYYHSIVSNDFIMSDPIAYSITKYCTYTSKDIKGNRLDFGKATIEAKNIQNIYLKNFFTTRNIRWTTHKQNTFYVTHKILMCRPIQTIVLFLCHCTTYKIRHKWKNIGKCICWIPLPSTSFGHY